MIRLTTIDRSRPAARAVRESESPRNSFDFGSTPARCLHTPFTGESCHGVLAFFSENYLGATAAAAGGPVGMTGATMQIPNHYFRMLRHGAARSRARVCVRPCTSRPAKEK